jgi:hypothetical protein
VRQNFDSIGTPGAARPGLASWAWVFYVPGVLFCVLYVTCMHFTPVALVPIFGHDDGHFMRQGVELTRGHWVGGYSRMTLIKGPGLPIFLALSHFFGLPYPISIALAESGSFFLLSLVVGRLAKAPRGGPTSRSTTRPRHLPAATQTYLACAIAGRGRNSLRTISSTSSLSRAD